MPMISVIMPVYNAEKHLPEAISCILSQTYKDFELIVVDDQSTDSSPSILKDFAESDFRVKIFTRENGGQSAARNTGLDHARGLFIMFADDDDIIYPTTLQEMISVQKKTKAELVCHGYRYIDEHEEIKDIPVDSQVKKIVCRKKPFDLLYDRKVGVTPCGKLYAKKLWKDLRFPEGLSRGEDFYTTATTFERAEKVAFFPNRFYMHRHHPGQSGKITTEQSVKDVFQSVRLLFDRFEEKGVPQRDRRKVRRFAVRVPLYTLLCAALETKKAEPLAAFVREWMDLKRDKGISALSLPFLHRRVLRAVLKGRPDKALNRLHFLNKLGL